MLTLASDAEMVVPVVAIVCGIAVAMVGMISSMVKSIRKDKEREQTRREVAAYVAEGSMSAEDAARILEAGTPIWERPNRRT